MTVDRDNARALIAGLRSDAGNYGRMKRGEVPAGELVSWDQSQERAWQAADALEAALTPPQIDRDALADIEYLLARHRVGPSAPNVRNAEDVALAKKVTDAVIAHLSAVPVEGDPRDVAHIACDCVPDLGPEHCHLCARKGGGAIVTWDGCSSRLPVEGEYPHQSGDFTVIGPECFTDAEANVIAYKGENYTRQVEGEVEWETAQASSGHTLYPAGTRLRRTKAVPAGEWEVVPGE